jgi:hypothetical protein
MEVSAAGLTAEEHQIRERMDALRRELGALQTRLEEIARAWEALPRFRAVRSGFSLVAATPPQPHQPVVPDVVSWSTPPRPIRYPELLRESARGTALLAPQAGSGEVALLVHSDSTRIAGLDKDPTIEFRAGLFTQEESGLDLVPVLVRLGPEEPENIYEAWVNEYGQGAEETLAALGTQESIDLHLYGGDGRLERTLRVANPLRAFAGKALGLLAGKQLWSIDAFHQARSAVYDQYPHVRSLWRALKA